MTHAFNIHEVKGTYGSSNTPCTVFIFDDGYQAPWYVVEGGRVVNQAYLPVDDYTEDGQALNVEEVEDIGCFTWSKDINDINEFIRAMAG